MPLLEKLQCSFDAQDKKLLAESLWLDAYLRTLLKKYWTDPTMKAELMDSIHDNAEVIKCLQDKK